MTGSLQPRSFKSESETIYAKQTQKHGIFYQVTTVALPAAKARVSEFNPLLKS